MANTVLHKKRGSDSTAPTAGQLEYGEIAINYHAGDEAFYIKNSSDAVVSIGGGGGGATYQIKTTTYTASSGDYLLCDCSIGWTLTLPDTPSAADYVVVNVVDADTTNYLTIDPNGRTIDGGSVDENMEVTDTNIRFVLVFDGTVWRVSQ